MILFGISLYLRIPIAVNIFHKIDQPIDGYALLGFRLVHLLFPKHVILDCQGYKDNMLLEYSFFSVPDI